MSNSPLLSIRNLKVVFPSEMGVVRAVEGIDLSVHAGECAAIVGESGCGKSVTSMAVMRLLNSPPALMQADELSFDDSLPQAWSMSNSASMPNSL